MKKRVNQAGWELLLSQSWFAQPDIVPMLKSVTEAKRASHFTQQYVMGMGADWLLDCQFRAGIRYHVIPGEWREREAGVWHLYPTLTPWEQDTRKARLPLHALWTRFHGGERVGLMRLISPKLKFARFRDPDAILVNKVRAMARTAESLGEDGFLTATAMFIGVVEILLRALPVEEGVYEIARGKERPITDPMVLKTRAFLAEHFQENLTREEIARQVGASMSTVERHYIVGMGESIMQTVMRLRLAFAKDLLASGHSVKVTAEQTGFYDAFHFSKVFKRHEGIAPSVYIQRARANSTDA